MRSLREKLVSFLIILMGILLSATMLFAQNPSSQPQGRTNRPDWHKNFPQSIIKEFWKIPWRWQQKKHNHRHRQQRQTTHKRRIVHGVKKKGHQHGYHHKNHRFGGW